MKIEGLYIWAIHISYREGYSPTSTQLWITTLENSIQAASKKALGFLKRNKRAYPQAEIKSIEAHGTIDA